MGKLNTVNNGKGSKPRPIGDYNEYINNWDNIFKKSLDSEEKVCDTKKHEDSSRSKKKRLES
jgi:hypothetical protein